MQNYQQGLEFFEQGEYIKARDYFLPYAQQGCAEAQYYLAKSFYKLTNKDKNKLWFDWFKKSAEQNYLPAVEWLCETRWFVDDPAMVDYALQGISLGSSYCKYLLGYDYLSDKGCTKQDVQKGLELVRESAQQGCWQAWTKLAELYKDGKVVKQDLQKVFDCNVKAFEAGHTGGALTIARYYFTGTNVAKNKTLALEWLKKAVDVGAFYAQRLLDTWSDWCDGDVWPETPIKDILNHIKIDF